MSDIFEKQWAAVGPAVKSGINGALFYVCWIMVVFYASWGRPMFSVGVAIPFTIMHFLLTNNARRDFYLIPLLMLVGSGVDTLMINAGVLEFAGPNVHFPFLAPIWITVLHLLYSTTINLSMKWVGRRVIFQVLFGGFGGGFSYWVGAKIGAAEPLMGDVTFLVIGAAWMVYCPFTYWVSKKIERRVG